MNKIAKGTPVRFTENDLGAMTHAYGGPKAVTETVVNAGDVGSYLEPSKVLADEGWHIIEVDISGSDRWGVTQHPLMVPAHESMFETVPNEI